MKASIFNNNKIIALAPMAGFTNRPFRLICKEFGADLVYSEMISARGILEDFRLSRSKSLELAKFQNAERPIFLQIFGNEPSVLSEAAKILIDKFNPDGIDINMGCPARKVIANNYGSKLMKNPSLASEIVKAVRIAIGCDKVLSCKTRLGWGDSGDIFEFSSILEQSGIDLLALHCRTKEQGFVGEPDWDKAREVKQKLMIKVLVNGGIKTPEDVTACLELTKADGVMIGQAAISRPWVFQEIKSGSNVELDMNKLCALAIKLQNYGNKFGIPFNEIKKHVIHYFKNFENSTSIRQKIACSQGSEELLTIIESLHNF